MKFKVALMQNTCFYDFFPCSVVRFQEIEQIAFGHAIWNLCWIKPGRLVLVSTADAEIKFQISFVAGN